MTANPTPATPDLVTADKALADAKTAWKAAHAATLALKVKWAQALADVGVGPKPIKTPAAPAAGTAPPVPFTWTDVGTIGPQLASAIQAEASAMSAKTVAQAAFKAASLSEQA